MTWSPLIRVVGFARRPRREQAALDPLAVAHQQPRRPQSVGLDVPPVHGRHCICHRCERESRTAA